ncbi:MAG: hypothetical protein IPJ40_14425 [Saprospirales bacterium]|nr:hypothetical protein [Saprospirales bacterium]
MKKRIAILLGITQLFVAFGALPTGVMMILQSDGSGLGMTVDGLEGTPFSNYFIPGLFLFVVNGLCQLVGGILSLMRRKQAGLIGLALGIILVLWICVQVYLIGLTHFLQYLFFCVGVLEVILGYLLYARKGE